MRKQRSDKLNKMITEKDEIINRDLLKKYSQFQSLSDIQKKNCLKRKINKKMKN